MEELALERSEVMEEKVVGKQADDDFRAITDLSGDNYEIVAATGKRAI